ncbi:MAG: hypothetical protein FJY67_03240 [Calditrichaeota bacterium]|nr:hypothetical protein [Calditrichota bacterium]
MLCRILLLSGIVAALCASAATARPSGPDPDYRHRFRETLVNRASPVTPRIAAPWSENVDSLSTCLQTGYYLDLAIEGDRLYAATNYGVEVFDISDPHHIRFLARAATPYDAYEVGVKSGHAYIADWRWGLYTFDMRDPGAVRSTNERSAVPYLLDDLQTVRSRAYLAEYGNGIRVLDVSNPAAPTSLGLHRPTPFTGRICVDDTLVWFADNNAGGVIASDLRTIGQFRAVGRLVIQEYITDLSVRDHFLALAAYQAGIWLFSFDRPDSFVVRGRRDFGDVWIDDVELYGTTLYAAATNGLHAIDITDPDGPELVWSDDRFTEGLAITGTYLYAAHGYRGITCYDIRDPLQPEVSARFMPPYGVFEVAATPDAAYVLRGNAGLLTLDLRDPARPDTASLDPDYSIADLVRVGDYLYALGRSLADSIDYILVYSLSEPLEPTLIWSAQIDADFDMIASCEPNSMLLALFRYEGGIELWDISDPEGPLPAGRINDANATSATLSGGLLYYIDVDLALHVVDVSEPIWPGEMGLYRGFEYAYDVVARDVQVFVADGDNGVVMLNTSDPENIARVLSVRTDWASYLTLADSLLFVSDGVGGVRILRLNGFNPPTLKGRFQTASWPTEIAIAGGLMIVADREDLAVGRFHPLGIDDDDPAPLPGAFIFSPPYPNPFNGTLRAGFTLPSPGWARIVLYDPTGRQVWSDRLNDLPAGRHEMSPLYGAASSGGYLLKVEAGEAGSLQARWSGAYKVILEK